jgi:hypothetical protein
MKKRKLLLPAITKSREPACLWSADDLLDEKKEKPGSPL